MTTVYEPIVTGADVEAAARETIQEWIEAYLAEAERQSGREPRTLPVPRSYHTAPQFDVWPEDQLPAVVLVSPGLAGKPEKGGNGRVRAGWTLGLAVVVSARDQESTNDLAKLYAAYVRTLLLQRGSLGGFAAGTDWENESYDELPAEDNRTVGAGEVFFTVYVDNVVNVRGGPVAVPDDPYAAPGDWPPVQEVVIETDREAIAS